jgi:alpha-glucosidase
MERLGNDPARARLLAAFQMTVRGVPFVYYGDELGLAHHDMAREAACDPIAYRFRFIPKILLPWMRKRGILTNRDECRSPMPWHGGSNAGFAPPTVESTWLPLHPKSAITNVASQKDDPTSVLTAYRRMLQLRRQSLALSSGTLELFDPPADPKKVLAYRRVYQDTERGETAEVLLNFSKREVPLDLRHLPSGTEALLHSNLHDDTRAARGKHVLRPWEAAVVLRKGP